MNRTLIVVIVLWWAILSAVMMGMGAYNIYLNKVKIESLQQKYNEEAVKHNTLKSFLEDSGIADEEWLEKQ